MSWFEHIMTAIRSLFKWWFIVLPWEQAIRIRIGKHIKVFNEGIHLSIPFIDRIYIQNKRTRVVTLSPQTLTTLDGKTITCSGSLRFKLDSILLLYQTLHQPEDTIRQEVEGVMADYIVCSILQDVTPLAISNHVRETIDLSVYGLGGVSFFLTDFAVVKTFRLIGGDMDRYTTGTINTTISVNRASVDF